MDAWYLNDHADTETYQKDIEQEFKVSRATASNMLQLMERKGLIVRESVDVYKRQLKEEWVDTFCKWVESLPYAEELIMYDSK